MFKLEWDQVGERYYEIGVDHAVLYPYSSETKLPGAGVAWNGISAITDKPEGAEATNVYADNIKYLTLRSAELSKGTIEAYYYPDEWGECDGSAKPTGVIGLRFRQQGRKTFGLSYRSKIGNDIDGEEYGYKLHLVYGATVSPSESNHQTVNDSPEASTFSWDYETTPVPVTGYKAVANADIDSTDFTEDTIGYLNLLESILYGATTDEEYSASKTYKVGDLVKKTGSGTTVSYYAAKVPITGSATWDEDDWVDVTIPRLPMPSELITILTPAGVV